MKAPQKSLKQWTKQRVGNRPVKLVNGIYRQQQSKVCRRKNTQLRPKLRGKELVRANNLSSNQKRLLKRQQDSGEHNVESTNRASG